MLQGSNPRYCAALCLELVKPLLAKLKETAKKNTNYSKLLSYCCHGEEVPHMAGSFILSQYFKGFKDRCCLDPGCCATRPCLCSQIWVACAGLSEVSREPIQPPSLKSRSVGRQSFPVLGGTANSEAWTCQESPCLAIMVANVLFPEATRPYGVWWGKLIRVMFETTESRENWQSQIPCN